LIDRCLTGNNFHQYLQPDREIDAGAVEVHGITNEFLADKPRFEDVAEDLIGYLSGAELIIHNAPFDVGFLDAEFARLQVQRDTRIADICQVIDTLVMARKAHPGQRNSLDALCKRYGVSNAHRNLHGALLDSEILADVYLAMTGGQSSLSLEGSGDGQKKSDSAAGDVRRVAPDRPALRVLRASVEEITAHEARLAAIDKASGGNCLWSKKPG
jgi:DNA polymerase-3 subunit epsilon